MVQKKLNQLNKSGDWRSKPKFDLTNLGKKGWKKVNKQKMAFKQWKARGFKPKRTLINEKELTK
jgi:hypothetical protein